ncbi:hypothetical protein IC620_05950 [Hazenella sp. IB182357]|uniref:Uncharacterized protein n=1 Tax=Polycladospora coralii TaxID=2771432 RepID=A0A926N877_9BACL|nr:hypothetical protein [Polycladospora coralii]MBD1371901.1 hypothetical protein [Polycladospora coralii]
MRRTLKKATKAKKISLHYKALDAVKRYEQALSIPNQHAFLSQEKQLALKLAQHYEKKDLTKYSKYCAQYDRLIVQLLDKGGETFMLSNDATQFILTERQTAGDPPDD